MGRTLAVPIICTVFGLVAISRAVKIDPHTCDGYLELPGGDRCYRVMNDTRTQREAELQCQFVFGGNLVSVTSPEVKSLMDSIRSTHPDLYNANFWLGAREILHPWKWTDGEDVTYQGCYQTDPEEEPFPYKVRLDDNSWELCQQVCRDRRYKYARVQEGKSCQCSNRFKEVYGMSANCYSLCPGNEELSCGGPDAFELFAIDGAYSLWGADQPNDHLMYQACAIIDYDEDFEYNDVECHEAHGFMCDLGPIEEVTAQVKCLGIEPNGTVTEGMPCYYISKDKRSWFQANQKCHELGGELAVFKDEMLQLAVNDFMREDNETRQMFEDMNFWIGLTRSTWKWESGDTFLYTDWNRYSRPSGENQNCIVLTDVGWNDVECDSNRRYVCEYDSSSVPFSYVPTTVAITTEEITTESTTVTTTTPVSTTLPTTTPEGHKSTEEVVMAALVAAAVATALFAVIIVACILYNRKQRRMRDLNREQVPAKDHYFFGLEKKPSTSRRDHNTSDRHSGSQPDVIPLEEAEYQPSEDEKGEPDDIVDVDAFVNDAFDGLAGEDTPEDMTTTVIDSDIPNGNTHIANGDTPNGGVYMNGGIPEPNGRTSMYSNQSYQSLDSKK